MITGATVQDFELVKVGHTAEHCHECQIKVMCAHTRTCFELDKVIGQGSFGKVFMVKPRWTNDATVYAMKVVKKEDVKRRNQMEHTKAERRIMAKITHPFVISLMFAFQVTPVPNLALKRTLPTKPQSFLTASLAPHISSLERSCT